jgi:hypothetical protein
VYLLTCFYIDQGSTGKRRGSVVEQTTSAAESDSSFVDLVDHGVALAGEYHCPLT